MEGRKAGPLMWEHPSMGKLQRLVAQLPQEVRTINGFKDRVQGGPGKSRRILSRTALKIAGGGPDGYCVVRNAGSSVGNVG